MCWKLKYCHYICDWQPCGARHNRRALLKLAFNNQILAKFESQTRAVATTLTLRIYTIPRGNAIYLASVGGCCLSVFERQCEKPDY